MKLLLRLAPSAALTFAGLTTLGTFSSIASAQQHAPQPAAPHVQPAAPAQAPKPAAPAALTPVKASAMAWAKERGLPVREIEVGPPERRVKRLFVPVTTQNWQSFVDTFSTGNDRMMLKLKANDNHLMPVVDGVYYLWARRNDYYGQGHEQGGGAIAPAMIVSLSQDESKHVREWYTHRANAGDVLWNCGNGCMDFIGNIELGPGEGGTNTLRPIGQAEVANAAGAAGNVKGGASTKVPMGTKLFDVLGIARSKDGRNMTYNIMHAANERVEVVGIPVGPDQGGGQTEKRVIREDGRVFVRDVKLHGAAIERFEKMTEAELLGPVPPQGVAGVVRPAK